MTPLLIVEELTKTFFLGKAPLYALRGVTLSLFEGETLGLVGESGCGKSTLAKILLHLESATSGSCRFRNQELLSLKGKELLSYRKEAQMVFQNPYASLSPRMKVSELLEEPFAIHKEKEIKAEELLELVRLPSSYLSRFPHELSGGERQRVAIARAIALSPALLICDEPTSALDVTIQAQIIALLEHLQERLGMSYLFISHNIKLVQAISSRIAVMYMGQVVEILPRRCFTPLHPYTEALLAAVPSTDPTKRKRAPLSGEPPSQMEKGRGCPFASRCPKATSLCRQTNPEMREVGEGHFVRCHLA